MISCLTKRPPKAFEQLTYFLTRLIATLVNTLQYSHLILAQFSPVSVGTAVIFHTLFASFLLLLVLTKRARSWIRT